MAPEILGDTFNTLVKQTLLTAVTGWVTTQRSRGTYHRSDTHIHLLGERWVRQAVQLPKIHQPHVLTKDREAWQKLVRETNGAPTTNNG